jgi:hypothetical protein
MFNITIRPTFSVISCNKKLDQEKRGLFGCHNYVDCKECKKKRRGWEFWGDNGYKQNTLPNKPTKKDLKRIASYYQTEVEFTFGSPIYYQAN